MAQEIEILAQGNYKPENILVSVSESNRKIDPFVESKLEEVWQAKLKDAQENNKKIYNGMCYRLNNLENTAGKLKIDFAEIDYKTYSCLKNVPMYLGLPRDFWGLGCFNCATIKTTDNKYIMVELSGKSMNTNQYEWVGGIMETKIAVNSGKDIFDHFFEELAEEILVSKNDVLEIKLKSIFITQAFYVAFYFEIILNISSTELQKRFKDNQDQDIKNILYLEKQDYLDTLKNHAGKNKNYIATIVGI